MSKKNYHSAVAGKSQNRKDLISMQEILDVVSVRRGIPSKVIISTTRKREICESRQICMFMAKQFRDDSLATIGTFYGDKDHATVLHANKTINNLIDTSPSMRGIIKVVTEDICEKLNQKATADQDKEIYICGECSSRNVEIKAWIKANTGELSDYEAVESNDSWCCNCKSHVPLRIIKRSELDNFPVKSIVNISRFA